MSSRQLRDARPNQKDLAAAKEVIEDSGATRLKDSGKVVPVLMQRLQGRADGRETSEVVRELLSG